MIHTSYVSQRFMETIQGNLLPIAFSVDKLVLEIRFKIIEYLLRQKHKPISLPVR